MPKIIENLKERLLGEAGRQLREGGYEAVTMRSIAKGCGVGVGTVYNYFPSKEALIAAYLLEDWMACTEVIRTAAEHAGTAQPVLQCIYEQLMAFSGRHEAVFRSQAAASGFSDSFVRYHALLRAQLAQPLLRFCGGEFTAEFAAEALLTWSMAGKAFDDIYEILKKVF